MPRLTPEIAARIGEKEERKDNSLRAKSLQRATNGEIPTTLTPHEWEEWYQQHGVPDSHRRSAASRKRGWRRWLRWR